MRVPQPTRKQDFSNYLSAACGCRAGMSGVVRHQVFVSAVRPFSRRPRQRAHAYIAPMQAQAAVERPARLVRYSSVNPTLIVT